MTSPLQRNAKSALAARLRDLLPRARPPLLDDDGSVREFRDNLLPHLTSDDADWIRECFEQGDGDELSPRARLQPKVHTAHSSATLAANTFAPFRGRARDLTIAGLSGFDALRLEAKHHPLPERLEQDRVPAACHPNRSASVRRGPTTCAADPNGSLASGGDERQLLIP